MDFVHGERGECYFHSEAIRPGIIPTSEPPRHLFIGDYTRSLPSVSRWGEDYNELIYPQRLSSFFLVFVISHLHNAASLDRDIGGALVFKLRRTNRRWIFHGWPVALQTGQHIKAASCFFGVFLLDFLSYSRTAADYLASYSLEGENPWLRFLFFFY